MALPDQDPAAPSRSEHVRDHFLGPVDADPATDEVNNGTVWYNTTDDELRVLKGGAIHNVDTTAV